MGGAGEQRDHGGAKSVRVQQAREDGRGFGIVAALQQIKGELSSGSGCFIADTGGVLASTSLYTEQCAELIAGRRVSTRSATAEVLMKRFEKLDVSRRKTPRSAR